MQDNEEILEAYVKSWTAGALDRATTRGSMAYTLVLHHLSSFIFLSNAGEKLILRNKLVKSLLRDYSRQQRHEVCKLFEHVKTLNMGRLRFKKSNVNIHNVLYG